MGSSDRSSRSVEIGKLDYFPTRKNSKKKKSRIALFYNQDVATTMNEDFDDPTDFTNPAFEGVDEHLRCPICSEFFQTAMILKTCSHTFCSLCIRRSLTVEQCCPSCRTHSVETSLHNNYVVDNLVSAWKNNR